MTILLDRDLHIPIYSPTCVYCRHLYADRERCCAAFPEEKSIPMEIWMGQDGHTTPHEGDHGIQFERQASDPVVAPTRKRGKL